MLIDEADIFHKYTDWLINALEEKQVVFSHVYA